MILVRRWCGHRQEEGGRGREDRELVVVTLDRRWCGRWHGESRDVDIVK